MIYVASDHGGFDLKNKILELLKVSGFEAVDMGPGQFTLDDDYPDYIIPCIKKVTENEGNAGIVICKNGVGAAILSNKFPGIRAALSWNKSHAVSSRNDDNTNVLVLPANYLNEEEAQEIVKAWLTTPFSNEERHVRRLKKISHHEKEIFK